MSQDTLIHGFVRPAVRAVAAHTGLTPNHLTSLRLATGLAAAMIFAHGTYGWVSAIGGLIFLLSMLLDRADGELARHTNQMSVAGHRYDLVSDCIVGFSTFIGIGIGVGHTVGLNALWLGALAGLGIGVLFLELNVMNLASVTGYNLFGGRIRVDPDDAMIAVPVVGRRRRRCSVGGSGNGRNWPSPPAGPLPPIRTVPGRRPTADP